MGLGNRNDRDSFAQFDDSLSLATGAVSTLATASSRFVGPPDICSLDAEPVSLPATLSDGVEPLLRNGGMQSS